MQVTRNSARYRGFSVMPAATIYCEALRRKRYKDLRLVPVSNNLTASSTGWDIHSLVGADTNS